MTRMVPRAISRGLLRNLFYACVYIVRPVGGLYTWYLLVKATCSITSVMCDQDWASDRLASAWGYSRLSLEWVYRLPKRG